MIPGPKKLEIFCGTGGVGKTTLAASRALFLSQQGIQVLLITIDPSKRLKEVLSMGDQHVGKIAKISFPVDDGPDNAIELDALLMSPEATMRRIFHEHFSSTQMTNKILNILCRPLGGLNEVFALLELENCFYHHQYDSIILDTAPGDHFLDFLKSGERINQFFNKSFIDAFRYLAGKRPKKPQGTAQSFIRLMAQSGLKKLLSYLEYVTGRIFIKDFIDAINTVYTLKDSFLRASELPSQIKRDNLANWFLVTSVEHNKLLAAKNMREQISAFDPTSLTLLINRCALHYLGPWAPQGPELQHLKDSLLQREENILKRAKELFPDYSQFQDINSEGPHGHLVQLIEAWQSY